MIQKWIARYRFGVTLALLFLLQLLVVGAILLPLAIDLPEAQRAWLSALVLQRGALWIVLAALLLLALGFGLKVLFDAYLTPVARLAEDAALLAANPGHRIAPQARAACASSSRSSTCWQLPIRRCTTACSRKSSWRTARWPKKRTASPRSWRSLP
ncbi:hypothetical protein [Cupriavidus sp. D39]|uniref:hypothetical protein n=1 Tax=Cupriavidus sp. D39 TaxID=2997877 RepID=UPI00227196F7|nr:hypothetical protein [Cupriavidus sp. D39]MCY0854772.1 hypothetical protein [Cupriavidus sp. D39]